MENLKILSVSNLDSTQDVLSQSTIDVVKHSPKKCYRILSKNDFGKKRRINIGFFNKKTNFIVSNENSLMTLKLDNNELKVQATTIDSIEKNEFLIYYIPILELKRLNKINEHILITTHDEDDPEKIIKTEVPLTFDLGRVVGKILKYRNLDEYINENLYKDPEKIKEDEALEIFLKLIIENNSAGAVSLHKKLILSSNEEFLFGIIFEFFEKPKTSEEKNKIYINDINVYSLTMILNLLGASYSIRKTPERGFQLRFKLPIYFEYLLEKLYDSNKESFKDLSKEEFLYKLKMFRQYRFYVLKNENSNENSIEIKELSGYSTYKKVVEDFKKLDNQDETLINLINIGAIELIPVYDLVFEKVECPVMFDFVTEGREKGTNYIIPGLPLLKNSDGDILGVMAVWTKDAAQEADKKFGIKTKSNLVSPLTGGVYQWIGIDGILGLYNFTK